MNFHSRSAYYKVYFDVISHVVVHMSACNIMLEHFTFNPSKLDFFNLSSKW